MLEVNKIYCMNFKDGSQLIDDNSVDLVFTDPPYPKQYFHTYQYLADYCPRIMKQGASLMVIAAHYSLENIIKCFDGKLKFRWINCMNQFSGTHSRMAMGIEVMWKPILWYVKGAYPQGRGFLRDGVEIIGKNGQFKPSGHKWEQDLTWASYYIERLTKVGDLVLDPYIGSGTVAEVCLKLNRKFIGFDISKDYCEMASLRIKGVSNEKLD